MGNGNGTDAPGWAILGLYECWHARMNTLWFIGAAQLFLLHLCGVRYPGHRRPFVLPLLVECSMGFQEQRALNVREAPNVYVSNSYECENQRISSHVLPANAFLPESTYGVKYLARFCFYWRNKLTTVWSTCCDTLLTVKNPAVAPGTPWCENARYTCYSHHSGDHATTKSSQVIEKITLMLLVEK